MGAMSSSSSKDEKGLDSNDSSDSGTDSHQQTWQPSKLTLADTAIVRTYLMRALRQPAELADIILDYASYGPRVEACREKPFYAPANRVQSVITTQLSRKPRVALRKRTGRDKVAVTTTYTGPTSATAALCLVTDPIPKGRWPGEKVKVKKIRFSMWSRDQGWGGDPQCKATYRGSYSWTEAVIIRPLPVTNPSSSAPVKTDDIPHTTIAGEDLSDTPMTTGRYNNCGPDSLTLNINSLAPPYPDPATLEAHFFDPRGYHLVPRKRRSKAMKGDEGENKVEEEIYRTWTVQHNLVAVAQLREHVVEWWDDDDNKFSNDKKDNKDTEKDNDKDNDMDNDKDDETGKGSGKGFVRTLRPGDRVGVLARAMYHGWSNQIEKIRIDIETCVRY